MSVDLKRRPLWFSPPVINCFPSSVHTHALTHSIHTIWNVSLSCNQSPFLHFLSIWQGTEKLSIRLWWLGKLVWQNNELLWTKMIHINLNWETAPKIAPVSRNHCFLIGIYEVIPWKGDNTKPRRKILKSKVSCYLR